MDVNELQERIAAFPQWHYQFEFEGGVRTPVSYGGQVNRQEQRGRYFFDALLRVTGGSLSGRRVLDLGCNAGFWSLKALEAGADFVLGVEGQQTYVEEAKLVFEAKGVEESRYRFEQGNIFDHDFAERFDVVFCLGLMENISKPVELLEIVAGVGAEIVVIDTSLSGMRSSFFEVSRLHDKRNLVDYEIVLLPTRQAVVELVAQFGFEALALAHNITDYAGLSDYRRERRLAFICSKDTSLAGLARAKAPSSRPAWVEAIGERLGR